MRTMLTIGNLFGIVGLHRQRMGDNFFSIIRYIQRKINGRIIHMQMRLGMRAGQFNGRALSSQRINGAQPLVRLGVNAQLIRQQFHQLRRALGYVLPIHFLWRHAGQILGDDLGNQLRLQLCGRGSRGWLYS